MKRIWLSILLLCTLSACSLAPEHYLSVTPHAGTTTRVEQTDAVTVEDYAQLKQAILDLVEAGQAEGSIRAVNYQGDLESDLTQAAYEVAKAEPLGAYAVDYMTHDCTLIVNYYEIRVRITFRRTAREIASIEHLASQALLETRLQQAVDDLEPRVTLHLNNYRDADIAAMVAQYCARHPGTVMEAPTVTVSAYPDSGAARILEINLAYTDTVQVLRNKQKAVQESVDAAAEYIRYRQTDRDKAELLFTYLTERFTYTAGQTATPVYDALCAGVADPTGLARAWQLICDRAGVACYTVTGLRGGQEACWNIVSFDGSYRHVDLAACILEEGTLRFRTDPEMTEYYWNAADYPACILVAEEAPPPEGETPGEEAPPAEEQPPEEETPPEEEAPPQESPEEAP